MRMGSRAGGEMAGHGAVVQVDVRWSFAIAALWLVVSLVRAVKLGLSAVQLRGIWKRATPVEGCGCDAALAGWISWGELCTSSDVDRPSVIGFFSPRILIPAEVFERLTTAELEQIVLHEVGHLRRADDWINLLQKISLVLVPLNPALLWIERRLCFERELACDDDVSAVDEGSEGLCDVPDESGGAAAWTEGGGAVAGSVGEAVGAGAASA